MRGLFGTLAGAERKMSSLELFKEVCGSRLARSGKTVTPSTALETTVVLGCVRCICNGVSQVPWRLYQEVDGDRKKAIAHPLYRIIYRRPNRWQTSFEFRETLSLHLELTWRAYVFVNRVGSKRKIVELIPIEPGRVNVKQNKDYTLSYEISGDDGAVEVFPQDAIWHLRGPSWNSWCGMDGIAVLRETIGLTAALESNQAEYQKNGAQASGLLAPTNKLSPEQYVFLSKWIDKHLPGGERFGKPLVLDDAAKYTPFGQSSVDQQLIETRRFQVEEICRGFGVQPLMVGFADKAPTFASAEQIFQAHVVHCLSPRYERIAQSAEINLLSEEDQAAGYYVKFTPDALMAGAAKDQAEYFARALGSGGSKAWMTQNEVRDLKELNRSADPEADKLAQPTNVQPKPPGLTP